MRTEYREQIYYTGNYMEMQGYPVTGRKKYQRKEKFRPTREVQAKLNQTNRESLLRRIVHLNFTSDDLVIHPTYRLPEYRERSEEMEKRVKMDWNNFRRRLQTLYRHEKKTLKYVMMMEFGRKTGYHFHIFLSGGVDKELIKKCWGKGRCYTDRLEFDENGVAGLVSYIQKDPLYGKAWCASKNLLRPEPKEITGRIRKKDLFSFQIEDKRALEKLYPGYICTDVHWEYNELNGAQYIKARFYKQDAKFYYDDYDNHRYYHQENTHIRS